MFEVVELRSISGSKSGFMVPIFAKQGSNQAFAQDLDIKGAIIRFLPIESDRFKKCDWLPPGICLDVGEAGVLAYVDENGVGQLMSVSEMRTYFLEHDGTSPIERLEIASLVGEKERLRDAIKDCQESYPVMAKGGWADREEKIFDIKEKMAAKKIAESPKNNELEKDFHTIERDLSHEKWTLIWLKLWQQGFSRERLMGIAAYVIDANVDVPNDFAHVYASILRTERNEGVFERILKLFRRYEAIDAGIVDLGAVSSYALPEIYRRKANLLLLDLLERDIDNVRASRRSWVQLWSNLYRGGLDRRRLSELAGRYLDSQSFINLSTAEYMIAPFVWGSENFSQVYDGAVKWLQVRPRSSILWARTFLAVANLRLTPDMQVMGEEWLKYHGGNTKIWILIWEFYRNSFGKSKYDMIAIKWLARARWDMRAWVDVFEFLASDNPREFCSELVNLGRRWLSSHYGNSASRRRVIKCVSYLESLSNDMN